MESELRLYVYFFFFQAEDGIRDYKVTGVQTCALPIYRGDSSAPSASWSSTGCSRSVAWRSRPRRETRSAPSWPPAPPPSSRARPSRSEEHTSELQSPCNLVCRLLLEKKKKYRFESRRS